SGKTVSKYFNKVLTADIRIQRILFAKASSVEEDCGFLGVLDGTYIEVTVPKSKKSRYRTRKVDGRDRHLIQEYFEMQSLVVIVSRYHTYLVDAGYTSGSGFLAPYRGTRYH
ncbi:hypothetical protein S83_042175, partial [Arachis hypogaea]